jgi:hypothetical protein
VFELIIRVSLENNLVILEEIILHHFVDHTAKADKLLVVLLLFRVVDLVVYEAPRWCKTQVPSLPCAPSDNPNFRCYLGYLGPKTGC